MFIVNQGSSAMLLETDSEAGLSHFQNSIYARSKNLGTEEEIDFFEHKFPFKSSVQTNPNSINSQQVHINVRRPLEINAQIDAKIAFDQQYKEQVKHNQNIVNSALQSQQASNDPKPESKSPNHTKNQKAARVRTKG